MPRRLASKLPPATFLHTCSALSTLLNIHLIKRRSFSKLTIPFLFEFVVVSEGAAILNVNSEMERGAGGEED